MRILITGASGLLGLNLALEACNRFQVIGTDRCQVNGLPFEMVSVDLLNPGSAEKVIENARPDWLIHCAALADVDACATDKDQAQKLNASLPGILAGICTKRSIKMAQISTDAVFDGTKSDPYVESDTTHPLSWYAKTKLLGEQAVLTANPKALVARVNFYGFSRSGTRSLAEFFIRHFSAGKPFKGFIDAKFNPTFAGDLAELLLEMMSRDLSGVYHAASPSAMSKYEFGVAIARRFGWDETLLMPALVDQAGFPEQRAHNLGMSVQKLSTDLDRPINTFSTGLDKFYAQYMQGYPQKIRSYPQVKDDDPSSRQEETWR